METKGHSYIKPSTKINLTHSWCSSLSINVQTYMALNKQWLFDINCKEANKLKINKLEKFNYFPNVIKSA